MRVKLGFRLRRDDDDDPPVATETVWARPGEAPGTFVIDNVPFFSDDASLGDVVATTADADGVHWFERVVERSTWSLLRVVFLDRSLRDVVASELRTLGCAVEHAGRFNLALVAVPVGGALTKVQRYLRDLAAAGGIDYEEPILREE